jgi:nucleotide-binding universal stress UspA family protein
MKSRYAKILVAVSGQRADEEALHLACTIARENKARVHVMYVIQVKRSLPLDAELEPEIHKAEDALRRAETIADELELEIETDLLQAREIGPAVVGQAREQDSDLIVMGIDYRRRFGEFHVGENVSYILKNAPCHVLLLRQPVQER